MPEGDTVHRLAERLAAVQRGRELVRAELRTPSTATADLTGAIVDDVVAHGKHLFHHLGGRSLHTHLRMDGRWQVIPESAPQRWQRPSWAARAILGTSDSLAIGFDLGVVEVLDAAGEASVRARLGPDPLSAEWDARVAARGLAEASATGVGAAVALGDQSIMAGPGQVYVTEVCFLAGVDPRRPLASTETERVVSLVERTMRANLPRRRRVFTGRDRPGQRTWVYGRSGRSCLRCGTPLRVDELGATPLTARGVVWCPSCQR
ncbi:DNA-formamidopyrimidine glycosylase family protein [Mycetocola reblochoni]|uniref:DNA-(apurinic or apyrimidinic site) lyase n=2 Tax=Mycetocola reblochoni TaxID=331618 RepID=A0A1R4JA88_9MICO|nr:DNA-formamidopyrimidine glycosylase family protein [Mycetocola reblochoni]RLP70047.1 Fpg/Nei family DNA glycosylase [Mycetocola reblochoni]SJN28956.1 Formamidopyrimidine-DNA glycosylase [Mycetocola reblochoni REB411]